MSAIVGFLVLQWLIERVVRGLHMPDVLGLEDLAEFLDLPADLVRRELEAGRLHGRRIGVDWRVHRDAVRVWLKGGPR